MKANNSVGSALHNLMANRPLKTSRILAVYLLLLISLTTWAMLTLMTHGLERDLSHHHIETNSANAINLGQQIERFINTRRLQLQAQANSAVVKQTVMQPERNKGLVSDYFENHLVIGQQYAQTLFDFKGDVIFSNAQSLSSPHLSSQYIEAHYKKGNISSDFKALYQGKKDYQLSLDPAGQYWQLALPVRYENSVEGLLVSYLPLAEMTKALNLEQLLDVHLSVRDEAGTRVDWGPAPTESWHNITTMLKGIKLGYALDMSSMQDSFDSARKRLILSALLIALLGIGLAMALGNWFFVRPIEKLKDFAMALSAGEGAGEGTGPDPHLEHSKRITLEIQALSDQITEMAKQIQQRERALIASNQTLKNNQDSLVHAEKMAGLGQVTAGVAHEINNPTGFVMNNLSMLEEYHGYLKGIISHMRTLLSRLEDQPEELSPAQVGALQALNQQISKDDLDFVINDLDCITSESIAGAERVRDITQALKGYAYSGEHSANVDLNDSLDATLKMLWNELKYHCKVEKDYGELPLVECMGGQINQVFMNLMVNAGHAMEGKQGLLTLRTRQRGDVVEVTIQDNGSGIKAEHLKRIFEPFFTTKAIGQGTGLGMSICYDIIKKHGGNIRVDSTEGEGTCFTVSLPIAPQNSGASDKPASTPSTAPSGTSSGTPSGTASVTSTTQENSLK